MKRKLRINDLKIQSFITELDSALAKTAKGGDDSASAVACPSITVYFVYYGAAQSWFPGGSTDCTKITTTTTTTTHH